MAASGTAILDFGAHPGANEASVVITGETGIQSTSETDAWVVNTANDYHTAKDHRFLAVVCSVSTGDVVQGQGFTIYGTSPHKLQGKISVQWAWA